MDLGRFADRNYAATATLTGGAWAPSLPLTNMQDESAYVSRPARQLNPGDLASSQFLAELNAARPVSLIALLFHTMGLAARYRLTVIGTEGTEIHQSDWIDVFPRVFGTEDLEYEDDNYWSGQLDQADLGLYAPHLWIPLPEQMIATAIRIELDDRTNAAGFFDLGGFWIAAGWSPEINFERGRDLTLEGRDILEEAPSGRLFGEERPPRRLLSLTWSRLKDAEARKWFDAGARARQTRTVLFVPDLSDPASTLREGFPGTFGQLPGPRFLYSGLNTVAVTFKETMA